MLSTTTRFLSDGMAVAAEVSPSSGAVQKRFVYGPGIDEPLVEYAGSGTASRSWLHADERGSVIAQSDGSGAVSQVNKYDEYGRQQSTNAGRFQYTGQMWLPEAGVYHYRNRHYQPGLGRFLQTDPIGYGGGANLYAYVLNDPVNSTDPLGLYEVCQTTPGYTIPSPTGDTIVGPKIVCMENGLPLPGRDQLLADTWPFMDFEQPDENFFSVLDDRIIQPIAADFKRECKGSDDVTYGLSIESFYKLEGGTLGHMHTEGYRPFIGPDDGVAAMTAKGRTAYMASPSGAYRIDYRGSGRFSVALIAGNWGASISTIKNRIAAWNKFGGQASSKPVGSGPHCTETKL